MKLNKKILFYDVLSLLTGCVGCVLLAIFIVMIIFTKLSLMIDLIWLSTSFVLLLIYIYSGKKATKLQAKWDYENRR